MDKEAYSSPMKSYQFPKNFVWGAATAALQIEGGLTVDGRGPSVWDIFCEQNPEKIFEGATPSIACDHYRRWQEDIELMSQIGLTGYRFSIAWPRLFPQGKGKLNDAGADFYDRLIDGLLEAGLEPNVTLYHWDLPQALVEQLGGGWEKRETVTAFLEYAIAALQRYGDRVKLWASINEPAWTTLNGYVTGLHPPCKRNFKEAIQAATNMVLAHALVNEQKTHICPDSKLGLVLNMSKVHPANPSSQEDVSAAQIADGVLNRWFFEPALKGTFPKDIWAIYEKRDLLPELAEEDREILSKPAGDYVGVNYYYPHYATAQAEKTDFHLNTSGRTKEECRFSIGGCFSFVRNPKGRYTEWGWEIDASGLYDLLLRVHKVRPDIPIYVTENGIGRQEELKDGTVDDQGRIDFIRDHLIAINKARAKGADVRGYYLWSLMDNFSWINGFKKRYGLLFVDRQTQDRYAKKSAAWYGDVARNNGFD